MGTFQHHPDDIIYVNGFQMSLAEFQLEEPGYSALPVSTIGIFYKQGGVHYSIDADGSQRQGVIPAATLDLYISKKVNYETNVDARRVQIQINENTAREAARTPRENRLERAPIIHDQLEQLWAWATAQGLIPDKSTTRDITTPQGMAGELELIAEQFPDIL